jgi:hypothetical protein
MEIGSTSPIQILVHGNDRRTDCAHLPRTERIDLPMGGN